MKHYTSYYGNLKNIPSNIFCLGISRFCPGWLKNNTIRNFKWDSVGLFAPSIDLLNGIKHGSVDISEYESRYTAELFDKIPNIKQAIYQLDEKIKSLGQFDSIAFMCYEEPRDFCHRHILSKIINDNGIECKEYGICKSFELF